MALRYLKMGFTIFCLIFQNMATYATWNPSDKSANITLSGSNLIATCDGTAWFRWVRSTISQTSGKYYWEYTITTWVGWVSVLSVGIGKSTATLSNYVGQDANWWGWYNDGTSSIIRNNATSLSTPAAFAQGDIIGIALDLTASTVAFYKNNTLIYTTGATVSGTLFAMVSCYNLASVTANFWPSLTYSPPAGFNAGLYTGTTSNGSWFMSLLYPSVKNHLISNRPMINYVAMWDSNTYWHLISPVTNRFSNLFWLNVGVVSQNIGVSGYTIPDLISTASTALYPKYVSGKRNCVTILIGINDFVWWASAATAWTNLQTLISDVQANGWEVFIITYFPYGWHPTETAKIITYNASIVANATSLGYSVIDAYSSFSDGAWWNLAGYVQADGAHLTSLGNSVMNSLIYPVVY